MPKNPAEPEVKFEKALAELQKIVEELEGGELELDDSLKKFERGVKLIQVCSRKLEDAQRRVDVVVKARDGKKSLKEFDEGESEPDELDLGTEEDAKEEGEEKQG